MEKERSPPAADEQELDTIFALLRDRRRRAVVDTLSERESSIPLRDLAAAVAAVNRESDGASAGATRDVATALHHVHLPKLDAADVIDYDTERNTVTPVETEKLAPFVDVATADR